MKKNQISFSLECKCSGEVAELANGKFISLGLKKCIDSSRELLKERGVKTLVSNLRKVFPSVKIANAMSKCELGHRYEHYDKLINYYADLMEMNGLAAEALKFRRDAWHALINDIQCANSRPAFFRAVGSRSIAGASPPADARFPALRRAYLNLCRMEICSTQIFFYSTRL